MDFDRERLPGIAPYIGFLLVTSYASVGTGAVVAAGRGLSECAQQTWG